MGFHRDFCSYPDCSAPIIWATNERDTWTSVDFDPTLDGDLLLLPRSGGRTPLAKLASFDEATVGLLRTAHWSSCADPNAKLITQEVAT